MDTTTSHQDEQGLATGIKKLVDDIRKMVREPVEILTDISKNHNFDSDVLKLQQVDKGLSTDFFRIMVIGRFKTGKSTFLNALLGKSKRTIKGLKNNGAPLPTDDLPTTATLTSIYYDENPHVRVRYSNRKEAVDWSFERYLQDAVVRADKEENEEFFRDIIEFELYFPTELGDASVVLVDSPGTDDAPERDLIAQSAAISADAVILLFRSDPLVGLSEQQYAKKMLSTGLKDPFTVVNMWDDKQPDGRFKTFAWNKIVQEILGGPKYSDQTIQDFVNRRLYFINVKNGLFGKLNDDSTLIRDSGLALFEHQLLQFLNSEKAYVKVERFVSMAEGVAVNLEGTLEHRLQMLQMDRDSFEQKYEEVLPRLEEIRRRQGRIENIIQIHRRRCEDEVCDSFDMMIRDTSTDLLEKINSAKLEQMQGFKGIAANMRRNAIIEELAGVAQEFVNERIKNWQLSLPPQPGLPHTIARRLETMIMELVIEVDKINEDYENVYREFKPDDIEVNLPDIDAPTIGLGQRLLAGAIGIGLGQPDYILTGGMGGLSGMARDMAIRVVVAGGLVLIGTPIGWAIGAGMIAGIIGSIFWGNASLEQELKKTTYTQILTGDPKTGEGGLNTLSNRMRPELKRVVDDYFGNIEDSILSSVREYVTNEEKNFKDVLAIHKQESKVRAAKISQINQDLRTIVDTHRRLKDVLLYAKQI